MQAGGGGRMKCDGRSERNAVGLAPQGSRGSLQAASAIIESLTCWDTMRIAVGFIFSARDGHVRLLTLRCLMEERNYRSETMTSLLASTRGTSLKNGALLLARAFFYAAER